MDFIKKDVGFDPSPFATHHEKEDCEMDGGGGKDNGGGHDGGNPTVGGMDERRVALCGEGGRGGTRERRVTPRESGEERRAVSSKKFIVRLPK